MWICIAILTMLPLVCCLISCMMKGKGILDVSILNSEWNDELFYFKQVESIIHHGIPQGYFGFNESHAAFLSFAAWSPVLVYPFVIFGKIFGWTYLSPILCNLFLMMTAMFLFAFLTEPDYKQSGILILFYCLFPLFTRYILSGMPEIICISHLIIFYALAINYGNKQHPVKLFFLFILAGLLTIMRPYMILFALLPVYFLTRSMKKKGKTAIGIIVGIVYLLFITAIYFAINKYLGAEYFMPLFFTDFITTFFTSGFVAGLKNLFSTLFWKGKDFFAYTLEGFRSGLAAGAFFGGFLTCFVLLIIKGIRELSSGQKEPDSENASKSLSLGTCCIHLSIAFFGMFFALILMYKLTEGSKHFLTFIAVALFLLSLCKTKYFRSVALLGAVFVYLYTIKATNPYDYAVPFKDENTDAWITEWENALQSSMPLQKEATPNYENVILWVFDDTDQNGAFMRWQALYAVPSGFGISCCQKDYIIAHFDELKSRYIAVAKESETDALCKKSSELIYSDEEVCVYRFNK